MAGGHILKDLRHLFRQHVCQDVDGVGLGFRGGRCSKEDLQQSYLQKRAGVEGCSQEGAFLSSPSLAETGQLQAKSIGFHQPKVCSL